MKIAIVQGTRPEILKNYSIANALLAQGVPHIVLHTNQHDTPQMCDVMYDDMRYSPTASLATPYRFGKAIDWLQFQFARHRVSHVLVNGDTAAALAGALAAMYSGLSVSHVEAGLRSHDPVMLEERHRIMVDSMAQYLFAYTQHEFDTLSSNPDVRGKVFLEGNTTVDLIHDFGPAEAPSLLSEPYAYLTLHRRELTDNRDTFKAVLSAISSIADGLLPILFPVHPRTQDALDRLNLWGMISDNVRTVAPQRIRAALIGQRHARLVLTDSGCVQEEAYILGVPCLTLRDNTERPLTVLHGANVVTGLRPDNIVAQATAMLAKGHAAWPDIYGKPGAGHRIVNRIVQELSGRQAQERIKRTTEAALQ